MLCVSSHSSESMSAIPADMLSINLSVIAPSP